MSKDIRSDTQLKTVQNSPLKIYPAVINKYQLSKSIPSTFMEQSEQLLFKLNQQGKLMIEIQEQKSKQQNDQNNQKEQLHSIQSESQQKEVHQLGDSDDYINNENKDSSQNKDDNHNKEDDSQFIVVQRSLGIFDKDSAFRQLIFRWYHSMLMRLLLIVATLVEIVAYLITDYSYRKTGQNMNDIEINEISDFLQLICNSFFTFEIILGIIALGFFQGQNTFLREVWNVVLIVILLSGWISRFNVTSKAINIIKFLRILTFFRLFPELMKKVNAFFSSFQHLGKTFFPLILVILFYAVVGMSFFQGHVESRCRLTEHPEHNSDIWEVDESNELPCGSVQCPAGTYCKNPADYGLPFNKSEAKAESLLFGYNLFNSIEWALFTVYNFLMVTGWVQTTYMYWRAQDKAVSAIYFVSLVLFLSQVISNIILATLYEGFIDETSIKNQKSSKKKVGKQASMSDKDSNMHAQESGKPLQRKNVLLHIESEENGQDNMSENKTNSKQQEYSHQINDNNSKNDNFEKNPPEIARGNHYENGKYVKDIQQIKNSDNINIKSESSPLSKSSQNNKNDNEFKQAMASSPIIKAIFLLNLFLQIITLCLDKQLILFPITLFIINFVRFPFNWLVFIENNHSKPSYQLINILSKIFLLITQLFPTNQFIIQLDKIQQNRKVFILFDSQIFILQNSHWLSKKSYLLLNKIDFATIIILFIEIIYTNVILGVRRYSREIINLIDLFVFVAHVSSYIYEGINGFNIFDPYHQFFILVRCTKVLRFFKIFFHYELFQNMTVILKTYYQTLVSIPEYILVFCILVILFAQIGREIFANVQPASDHHVLRVNFNTLADSVVAVVLIFYNEEWHVSMYNFMRFVGYQSVIYYLVCMLVGWVLFVRLFIAIFISQFMKWLRINEKEFQKKKEQLDTIDMIFKRCCISISNICNKKGNSLRKVNVLAQRLNKQQSIKLENMYTNEKEHANKVVCIENGVFSNNLLQVNQTNKQQSQQQQQQQQVLVSPSINNQLYSAKSKFEFGSMQDNDIENIDVDQEQLNFKTFGERRGKKPTIIGIRKSIMRTDLRISTQNGDLNNNNFNPVDFLRKQGSSSQIAKDINISSRPMMDGTFNEGIHGTFPTERNIPSFIDQKNQKKSSNNQVDDDYIEPKQNKATPQIVTPQQNGFSNQIHSSKFTNELQVPMENNQLNRVYNEYEDNNDDDDDDDYNQQKRLQKDMNQLQNLRFKENTSQTSIVLNGLNKNSQNFLSPSQSLVQIASGIYNQPISQQFSTEVMFNAIGKNKSLKERQDNQNIIINQQQVYKNGNYLEQQGDQSHNQIQSKDSYKSNQQRNTLHQKQQGSGNEDRAEANISLNLFSLDNKFRQICTQISESLYFDIFMVISIIVYAGILVWDSPFLDPQSSQKNIINILYIILAVVFFLELLIHLIQYGLLFNGTQSYLRGNVLQLLDFVTTLATILYIFNFTPKSNFIFKCIAIFRIIFLLSFLSKYNKDIAFAGRLMAYCSSRMFKLIIFAVIYLLMNGIVITKLLKDSSWKCKQLYHASSHDVVSKIDCFDLGGDWIESSYNFNSIVDSLQVLFMVQASEGWLQIMLDTFDSNSSDYQLYYRQQSIWSIFFIQYFFIANICILNMFVGLIVESLLELIELEHGTAALTKQQKEWHFIKKSINKLVPIKKEIEPNNIAGKFLFRHLISGNSLKIFFYSFTVMNGVSFLFFKNRMAEEDLQTLRIINSICLAIMALEILCRMLSLGIKRYFFEKVWNAFDIGILIIGCINLDYQFNETITIFSNYYRIFDGIAKGLQLLRLIRVFNHFLIFRKLLNSLNYALSSILGISLILIVFLYSAVLLSLNLFPYLKFQSTINSYDINFQGFFQALFSFIRIVTLEMWYLIPFEASQKMAPDFVCRDDMYDYNDFKKYGYQSCGSVISFLFFYVFFLIFTLIILNLFVATIIEAYKEAFSADESAINHYQLDDILKLWTKFDPQGKGYISYKEFWQFSSQIAIVYGVNSEELLDIENKNRFLKTLDIPIYEDPIDKIFCYKFHDVVVKLSKISVQIKYGVTNLEPKSLKLREELDSHIKATSLQYEQKIKSTEFTSGDMILLIVLSRKAKMWKKQYIQKAGQDANIFHIQSLFKRMQSQKQNFLDQIKKQIAKEEEEERIQKQQHQQLKN